jgi:hypothetical protein
MRLLETTVVVVVQQGDGAINDEGIIALKSCPKIQLLNLMGCFKYAAARL